MELVDHVTICDIMTIETPQCLGKLDLIQFIKHSQVKNCNNGKHSKGSGLLAGSLPYHHVSLYEFVKSIPVRKSIANSTAAMELYLERLSSMYVSHQVTNSFNANSLTDLHQWYRDIQDGRPP